jgi:hypothetical protein
MADALHDDLEGNLAKGAFADRVQSEKCKYGMRWSGLVGGRVGRWGGAIIGFYRVVQPHRTLSAGPAQKISPRPRIDDASSGPSG